MDASICIGDQTAILHKDEKASGFFHIYEQFDIDDSPREIQVYLPRSYSTEETRRYPVVYMNDGQTAFEARGLGPWSWEVDITLDKLYNQNEISEVIVVGVTPIHRADEYLTIKQLVDFDNNIIDNAGELPEYAEYLAHGVKPFIDEFYRTDPDPDKTIIIGASFAAIASLYTAITHPESFGIAAVMSSSFSIGFGMQLDPKPIEESDFIKEITEISNSSNKQPKLWIDWGVEEPGLDKISLEVIEYLKSKLGYTENKNIFPFEDQMGTHDERAWAYRFGIIMKKFYSK